MLLRFLREIESVHCCIESTFRSGAIFASIILKLVPISINRPYFTYNKKQAATKYNGPRKRRVRGPCSCCDGYCSGETDEHARMDILASTSHDARDEP
jgi:hypothetical protein